MIELTWFRDTAGYRLLDPVAAEPAKEGETLLGSGNPAYPHRVVRCGGELAPYQPLAGNGGLWLRFAQTASDPDGVLEFVRECGPLTRAGLNPSLGDEVPYIARQARAMIELAKALDPERAAPDPRLREGMALGELEVVLEPDETSGRYRITYQPPNLITALWLQCAEFLLMPQCRVQQCGHCGTWFEAGPGRGRRYDAKFCSEGHRTAYNNARRGSKERKNA